MNIYNIPSANEARQMSDKNRHIQIQEVLDGIHECIAGSIRAGNKSADYLKSISYVIRDEIIDILTNRGYNVKYHSCQRDGDSLHISWE